MDYYTYSRIKRGKILSAASEKLDRNDILVRDIYAKAPVLLNGNQINEVCCPPRLTIYLDFDVISMEHLLDFGRNINAEVSLYLDAPLIITGRGSIRIGDVITEEFEERYVAGVLHGPMIAISGDITSVKYNGRRLKGANFNVVGDHGLAELDFAASEPGLLRSIDVSALGRLQTLLVTNQPAITISARNNVAIVRDDSAIIDWIE